MVKLNYFFLYGIMVLAWLPVIGYTAESVVLIHIGIYSTICFIWILFFLSVYCNKTIKIIYLIGIILSFAILLYKIVNRAEIIILRTLVFAITLIMAFYIIENIKICTQSFLWPIVLLVTGCIFLINFSKQAIFSLPSNILINPNLHATSLLVIFIYLVLGGVSTKNLLYAAAAYYIGRLIMLTGARSTIYSILLMVLLYCFYSFIKRINIVILRMIPVVIPLIIVVLDNIIDSFFIGSSGLNGRTDIWGYAIRKIIGSPANFLGGCFEMRFPLRTIDGMYVASNAHNSYLELIWICGVPCAVLILVIYYLSVKKYVNKNMSNFSFIAYLGLIAVFINASLETNLIDGIIGISFLSFYLVRLTDNQHFGKIIIWKGTPKVSFRLYNKVL